MKPENFQLSEEFNIGIIGAGKMADVHITAYKYMQNVKVIAICDIIERKAQSLAEKWGIIESFTNYENLLEVKDIDIVDVCTPTHTHAPIACDALSHGYNVLLEKPMALSVAECDAIIKESRKHKVSLCVNHHALFYSSIRKAKSLLDSGFYDLQSMRVSHKGSRKDEPKWSLDPKNGGLLWEVGTHGVYLEQFFLPDIKEVYAIGNLNKSDLLYDNFSVLLRTSGDSFGIMDYSFTSNRREFQCQMMGGEGKQTQVNLRHDILIDKSKHRSKWSEGLYEGIDLLKKLSKLATRRIVAGEKKGVEFMKSKMWLMWSFLKSIEENEDPPVTPEHGKDSIKLLECIKKSLDTHEAIRL